MLATPLEERATFPRSVWVAKSRKSTIPAETGTMLPARLAVTVAVKAAVWP